MDRNAIIFLSSIGLSSSNIIKILYFSIEKNLSLNEFLNLEENQYKPLLKKVTFDKIKKFYCKYEEILENTLNKSQKLQVKISTILDENYPSSLRRIEHPPAILYIRGKDIKLENNIAIVGSRKHTSYGIYAVNKFVDELSSYNFTIVSGMAYGIDALSHKRALEKNMKAIAVLGNGIDIIYPKANTNLYMNLLDKATIVSEYPFGMKATKFTFPQRNRIISGLSEGVIVVEAKEKSGSLITARLAAEQGKEVFAIPGNINSIYSKGTNLLIRDGATPLLQIEDILPFYPSIIKKEEEKHIIKNLSEDENLILNLMEDGSITIEEICNKSNFDVIYINSLLTKLELKSAIEKISLTEYRII